MGVDVEDPDASDRVRLQAALRALVPSSTLVVGSVTALAPGADPYVNNSGTLVDVILEFGIPAAPEIDTSLFASAEDFSGHVDNMANPHGVTKAQVGLGSADDTSDAGKPVSTAQQNALDLKANLSSPTFTGVPEAPTADAGTDTGQLATTAFVQDELAPRDVRLTALEASDSKPRRIATGISYSGVK